MSGDVNPLAGRAARGAAWVLGLRAGQRVVGFARLVLLTHLLGPADFGTVGVALLALEMMNAISQTGFRDALIQRRGEIGRHLDVAWTFHVVRGAVVAGILIAVAPAAAGFFEHPQSVAIIRAVAIGVLLQGFTNIGVVVLERDLEFRPYAAYHTAGTVAELVASVAAALVLRNAWALVIGLLVGDAVRLVASYRVHPFRPRLALHAAEARSLFRFGRWILVSNLFLFLAHHGDDAVVGKLLGVTALGLYQLAYQLSHVTIMEVTRVLSQVALPSYARMRSDIAALRRVHMRVLRGTALVAWPFAGLVCVFAGDFTRLVLAERWLPVAPLLQILAIHAAIRAIGAANGPVLLATGRPQWLTALTFVKFVVIAVSIVPLVLAFGVAGAAVSVLIAAVISNACSNAAIVSALGGRARDVLTAFAPPAIATALMTAVLAYLRDSFGVEGLADLALLTAVGAAFYAAAAGAALRMGPRQAADLVRSAAAAFAPVGSPGDRT